MSYSPKLKTICPLILLMKSLVLMPAVHAGLSSFTDTTYDNGCLDKSAGAELGKNQHKYSVVRLIEFNGLETI